jgi:hypothetical protein
MSIDRAVFGNGRADFKRKDAGMKNWRKQSIISGRRKEVVHLDTAMVGAFSPSPREE